MITSANWGEILLPGLRRIFNQHLENKKDYIPVLYNREDSTKAQEFNLGTGNLGLMEAWNQATGVAYEDISKGFKATYTHQKLSKGIKIERELWDDEMYGEMRKRVRSLAQTVYNTRQYHAAKPFNDGFSTFLGPDGKALFATDHPKAPSSGSVQSNVGTDTLTAANLEKVRTAMKGWTDDKNNLLGINPDLLIVPPALRKTALVIADSDKEPDGQLNNVNVWKGSITVIEFDFLTDANNWFVADTSRMKNFLNWYDRRKAKIEMEKEFDTEEAKYKTVGRWSYGIDDWSFIFGNNPV